VIFGFRNVRHRGIAETVHRLEVAGAPVNLFMLLRRFLRQKCGRVDELFE
jgi:hypothetical protein